VRLDHHNNVVWLGAFLASAKSWLIGLTVVLAIAEISEPDQAASSNSRTLQT
jgi:hypothetical protein